MSGYEQLSLISVDNCNVQAETVRQPAEGDLFGEVGPVSRPALHPLLADKHAEKSGETDRASRVLRQSESDVVELAVVDRAAGAGAVGEPAGEEAGEGGLLGGPGEAGQPG